MDKAAREAKVHTSWIEQNPDYSKALSRFVKETLAGQTASRFLASFVPFQRRVAQVGMVNSLSQLVLKLASPGVPDFYQGTELWDLSLVDPDNRGAVDFARRQHLLANLRPLLDRLANEATAECEMQDLFTHWTDGCVKLLVTTCGMRFRQHHRALMLHGAYTPLELDGERGEHVVAFARHDDSGTLVVIAPRLVAPLVTDDRPLPIGAESWAATQIVLPPVTRVARYRHVITGEWCETTSDRSRLPIASALATCPVALLWASAREQGERADAA